MEEEIMPSVAQTEEEVTPEVIEETDSNETVEESVDEVRERLQKAEELANNYKIRAEKAEKQAKTQPKVETGLSSKDTIALINAKVHEDDVDDVIEYARFKKIPIGEALKSTVIKASLKEKEELRNTANATNTGRTRTPNSKVSGESLLDKAQKTGEIPESDEALKAMLDARYKK